jgi:hypothetical protein
MPIGGNYYDIRIQKKIELIFDQIQRGQVSAEDMVNRLAIEYYVKKIDEIDITTRGKTDEFELTLDINSQPTRIFFTPEFPDENIPSGQHVTHPRTNIGYMIIINMGPNDIRYATNRQPGDARINSYLKVNEFRNVPARNNTIYSLFMRAIATVGVVDTTANIRVEFVT